MLTAYYVPPLRVGVQGTSRSCGFGRPAACVPQERLASGRLLQPPSPEVLDPAMGWRLLV